MKKWIVWLLVGVTLTFLSIYVFIPSKIAITGTTASAVSISAAFRLTSQQNNWEKWWRDSNGSPHTPGEPFRFNGTTFRPSRSAYNVTGIEIKQDDIILESELTLISVKKDSTWLVWNGQFPSGNNPFMRIQNHKKAQEISKNLMAVLNNITQFTSDPQKVYGLSIVKTSFPDTNMLSTRFITSVYPSTEEIYKNFNILRKSIQKQDGKITGNPMVNVRMVKADSFETQVAIPTSHSLKNDGAVFSRKMVPGNFLSAIVSGGEYSIRESMQQLDFYLKDHGKIQMARPFEQLITDRSIEPDTTKWLTRIYLPVVE
jgi:effector-binding domain-containing protein